MVFERKEVTTGARTLVVVPDVAMASRSGRALPGQRRSSDGRLEEAIGLAAAIGVAVIKHSCFVVRKASAAVLFGSGQVEIIKQIVVDNEIELVVIDAALTPIQQRNLEKAFDAKVIDRTGLILEIFGERAATAEGRLQVELAHLDYQQGRLVRSWTHLERQRGGFGFLGGPGETQIEADRRLIRNRMAKVRRSLDDVRRTRSLHRERRQRAPWPVVALVGYTNAGKSTLFNRLSNSSVIARDQLFATLDPTMRQIPVAGIGKVIMSDTVGFVSDLPTQLVAAFRATLEEVLAADLLLHIRDISHPDTDAQRDDVLGVLRDLGIGDDDASGRDGPRIIEVLNKADLVSDDNRMQIYADALRSENIVVSALTGEGVANLLTQLSSLLGGEEIARHVHVAAQDGKTRAWVYANGKVLSEETNDSDGSVIHVIMTAIANARLNKMLSLTPTA